MHDSQHTATNLTVPVPDARPWSNKAPGIQALLRAMSPYPDAIDRGCCPTCGNPVLGFRDELSAQEYVISGWCQHCQDGIWPERGEPDAH